MIILENKIKESLKEYNLIPKKKLGQNFILDFNILKKIATVGSSLKNKSVLEIGPGPGGLTKAILNENPKKLILVEKDIQFKPILKKIIEGYPNQDIALIIDDFLAISNDKILNERVKIFSNLPYYISTEILFSLLPLNQNIHEIVFTFQKEVAERLTASPNNKSYSRISVVAQYSCDISREFNLNAKVFFPVPKVDSTVIKFTPKKNVDPIIFKQLQLITRLAFGQRRKILKNSLSGLKNISYHLEKTAINESLRAEQVTVNQYKNLASSLINSF